MAGGVEGAGFWLPLEFLSDDDFFMDKENLNNAVPDSEFCFPTEFPYDFETQNAKDWLMSTLHQSTKLGSAGSSSNDSQNGPPSPPTTPLGAKYDFVGDLIYLDAGQVDNLKLDRGFLVGSGLAPARSNAQFYQETKTPIPSVNLNAHFQQKQLHDHCGILYSRQQMHQNRGTMDQAAWTPQQSPTRGRTVLLGGSGGRGGCATAKRPCVGTGVFLPRRYENTSKCNAYSSDSQMKSGRAAVQLHTEHLENVNGFRPIATTVVAPAPTQPGLRPRYVAAGRRAKLLQQQQRLLDSLAEGRPVIGRDIFLPQEWTY